MDYIGIFSCLIAHNSLFRYLDDLYSNMEVQSSRFIMGWTVAVGMVTSLPFLVFSGPITDSIGHMNVIVIGMQLVILLFK